MFTPQQVCNILGISKATLLRWESEGIIDEPPRENGNRIYSINEVKDIIGKMSDLQKRKTLKSINSYVNRLSDKMTEISTLLD